MRKALNYIIFSYFIFASSCNTYTVNLIFDLGQVLVRTSSLRISWHIGLYNFVGFYNPFTLEHKLFEFLQHISPEPRAIHPITLHNGHIIPSIMQDWLTGLRSSEEIIKLIDFHIDKESITFLRSSEKRLIRSMAHMIFKPEIFAQTVYPIKDAIKLLKQCYRQVDTQGNRKHKIYILSNWDHESFSLLAQKLKFQKLFRYADGIIISGLIHMMKPDPNIFLYLFDQYSIDPTTELTIFIDDDPANISAANRLGFEKLVTIQCKNCNIKEIKDEFKKRKII